MEQPEGVSRKSHTRIQMAAVSVLAFLLFHLVKKPLVGGEPGRRRLWKKEPGRRELFCGARAAGREAGAGRGGKRAEPAGLDRGKGTLRGRRA